MYKFTTHPQSRDSQSQKTILAPSANKQTHNYDTDYPNHYLTISLSLLIAIRHWD